MNLDVASPASRTTILYLHDLDDNIIAETDASGNTLREYVWLDDTPLAIVESVATSPAIFYVHTDHLMRPLRMTDSSAALAWSVAYDPFGAVASVNAISSSIDLRFPGHWFQLESGLHYNWHRHYDASTGRYLQPDPLLVDDTQPATIFGIERGILMARNDSFGALNDWQQIKAKMGTDLRRATIGTRRQVCSATNNDARWAESIWVCTAEPRCSNRPVGISSRRFYPETINLEYHTMLSRGE